MRIFNSVAAAIALFAAPLMCAAADNDHVRVPVLLELFTSEGCSSCPPADRLLELVDKKQPVTGADLIVLSEHVDYWDRLGWKDPFSSPLYTARQEEYANRLHLGDVYTPQLFVDGRVGVVGSDGRAVASAIQKAIREPKIPIVISGITHDGNHIMAHIELESSDQKLGSGQAVLYVAIADNSAESHVARGENAGRSLTHVAVTRVLRRVGRIEPDSASTRDITLDAPSGAKANASRLIAFLQDPGSGRVLGAAQQKFE